MKALHTAIGAAASLAALSLGLPALGAPASAATLQHPVDIAGLAPPGTNTSTPRENWDQCDVSPGSLLGISYDVKTLGFEFVQSSDIMAPPRPIYVPPSEYVACTIGSPFFAPNLNKVLTYSLHITDVAHQAVYVGMSPPYNYQQSWLHTNWDELMPGKSVTYTFHLRDIRQQRGPYPFLVRPSIPPKNAPDYTDWLMANINYGVYVDPLHPSGACKEGLPGGPVEYLGSQGPGGSVSGVASAPKNGYWVASSWGAVSSCGARDYINSDDILGQYIVSDPTGDGYWTVNSNGFVTAFGAAHYYGQLAHNTIVTGAVADVSGKGYWLVNGNGNVFRYGNAPYYGEAHLKGQFNVGRLTITDQAVVGIAPTEGMHGYVLVARDGAVYGYGKKRGGACGPVSLANGAGVAGVAPDFRTGGYWVAETDGHVAACDAPSYPYKDVSSRIMGIGALNNGLGYRLVTDTGKVYDYGAAVWRGNPN